MTDSPPCPVGKRKKAAPLAVPPSCLAPLWDNLSQGQQGLFSKCCWASSSPQKSKTSWSSATTRRMSEGENPQFSIQTLFQILFHLLKSPLHRAPHGTLMDTLCPCYFGIALAEDHTGIHPATLRFGQGIERSAQMAEQLHALQQLLRGGFGNAGGVFDPVLAIERILRFVADDPPLISRSSSRCV